jgi:hypothetical protein
VIHNHLLHADPPAADRQQILLHRNNIMAGPQIPLEILAKILRYLLHIESLSNCLNLRLVNSMQTLALTTSARD